MNIYVGAERQLLKKSVNYKMTKNTKIKDWDMTKVPRRGIMPQIIFKLMRRNDNACANRKSDRYSHVTRNHFLYKMIAHAETICQILAILGSLVS
jgi:hypothetical protein